MQHGHLAFESPDEFHVMLDDNDRAGLGRFLQQVGGVLPFGRGHPGGGFVDQQQLRLNSAIAAALVWGFATDTARLPRQSHEEIQALIDSTDLGEQMKSMAVWDGWESGARGRQH